ncbi:hypothetical protein PIB30_057633 [Stylosanthes scabra]|uniref:Uncharacterized protein n=1 Tax=Stylosanthes scabra TaxID=79078 RepID=A0ABU6UM41_9FABA|nr:hypothetical protein [Stylosanthes scabra]
MDLDYSVVDCSNQTIDEYPEEVLRNLINATEEIQNGQDPQPLKSVVEEEPDHSNICEDEIPKEDNDEAGIRPNKTYLALSNEVGGSSNLTFSEKYVRNYISSKLRTSDVNLEVKEMLMHGLPFASFTGVNHHGKSTPLGCALLGNKEIPSFE